MAMFVDHLRPVDLSPRLGVTGAEAGANLARVLGISPPPFEVYGRCPSCRVFRCHLLDAPNDAELPRECLDCGHTWIERLETRSSCG